MSQKSISIRIDETLLSKLHIVAAYNERSANGQVLMLIKELVEQYEKSFGPIQTGR